MNDLVIGYYGEQEFLPEFKSYSSKHNYNPILYNKREGSSPDPYFNCINLKNIGQHTHTYLHHVINNYNNLTDVPVSWLNTFGQATLKITTLNCHFTIYSTTVILQLKRTARELGRR